MGYDSMASFKFEKVRFQSIGSNVTGLNPIVDRCLQTCCAAILANMAQSGNGVMAVDML